MSSEDTKILGFNQYQKSDMAPFIIYADLELLIEKIDRCKSNPENLSTAKLCEHIPSGCLMSTTSSFKNKENKHDVYGGKNCMWKFCESLIKEEVEKFVIFVKKNLKINTLEIKKYCKVRGHCHHTGKYRRAARSICNLKYSDLKKISTRLD